MHGTHSIRPGTQGRDRATPRSNGANDAALDLLGDAVDARGGVGGEEHGRARDLVGRQEPLDERRRLVDLIARELALQMGGRNGKSAVVGNPRRIDETDQESQLVRWSLRLAPGLNCCSSTLMRLAWRCFSLEQALPLSPLPQPNPPMAVL